MKKKIALIIALSLIFVGVFGYLTQREYVKAQEYFEEDGYILIPDESGQGTNMLCNFTSGTKYQKSSYDNKIVFNDINNSKVAVDTNNFIHYSSDSLAGLSDTVLLDTDSLNAEQISYYSLTSRSKLAKTGDGYVTSNAGENVEFSNFIWKTSSERYMVVSDTVTLVVSDESQQVFNGYLEVEYVDEGVVHLVNQDGTYSTISSDAYLELANGIRIYLGSKNVSDGENIIVNMAQMVVDSDDNIEIIPDDEYKKENVKQPQIIVNATDGQDGEDGQEGEAGISGESGQNGATGNTGTPGGFGNGGANGLNGSDGLTSYQQYIKGLNIEGVLDYNEWKSQVTSPTETYNDYIQSLIDSGIQIDDYDTWYENNYTGVTGSTGETGSQGLTPYREYVANQITTGSGIMDYYEWLEDRQGYDTYEDYTATLTSSNILSYADWLAQYAGDDGGDGRGGAQGVDGNSGQAGDHPGYDYQVDKMPEFFIVKDQNNKEMLNLTAYSANPAIGYKLPSDVIMDERSETVEFILLDSLTNSIVYKRTMNPTQLNQSANENTISTYLTGDPSRALTKLKQNTQYTLLINAKYYVSGIDNPNDYRYQTVFSKSFTTESMGLSLSLDGVRETSATLTVNYNENIPSGLTDFQIYLYQSNGLAKNLLTYKKPDATYGYKVDILNDTNPSSFSPSGSVTDESNGKVFGIDGIRSSHGQANLSFSNLTADTTYYAIIVIPNSSVPFTTFEYVEFTTLKTAPKVEKPNISYLSKNNAINVEPGTVNATSGNTQFEILEYRYDFYLNGDPNKVVYTSTRTDEKPFNVPVDGENIKLGEVYYCYATVLYIDNDGVQRTVRCESPSNIVKVGDTLMPSAEISFKTYGSGSRYNPGKTAASIIDANLVVNDTGNLIDLSRGIKITVSDSSGYSLTKDYNDLNEARDNFDFAFGGLKADTQYNVSVYAKKISYTVTDSTTGSTGGLREIEDYLLCVESITTGSYTPLSLVAGEEILGQGFSREFYFSQSDDVLEDEKNYGFEFSQAARDVLGEGIMGTYDLSLRALNSISFKIYKGTASNLGTEFNFYGADNNAVTFPNENNKNTVTSLNTNSYDFYNDARFLYVEGKTDELKKNYISVSSSTSLANVTTFDSAVDWVLKKDGDAYTIEYSDNNNAWYLKRGDDGSLSVDNTAANATKWSAETVPGSTTVSFYVMVGGQKYYLLFNQNSWKTSSVGNKDLSIIIKDSNGSYQTTTELVHNGVYKIYLDGGNSRYANQYTGFSTQYYNGVFPANYVEANGITKFNGRFHTGKDSEVIAESYVVRISAADMPDGFAAELQSFLEDDTITDNEKRVHIELCSAKDKWGNEIKIGSVDGLATTNIDEDRYITCVPSEVPPSMVPNKTYVKPQEFTFSDYSTAKADTSSNLNLTKYPSNYSGDIADLESAWSDKGYDTRSINIGMLIKDTGLEGDPNLSWLGQFATAVRYYIYEKPVENIYKDNKLIGFDADDSDKDDSGLVLDTGWIDYVSNGVDYSEGGTHLPYYTVYYDVINNGTSKKVTRGKEYTIALEVKLKATQTSGTNSVVIFPTNSTTGSLSPDYIAYNVMSINKYEPQVLYFEYQNNTPDMEAYNVYKNSGGVDSLNIWYQSNKSSLYLVSIDDPDNAITYTGSSSSNQTNLVDAERRYMDFVYNELGNSKTVTLNRVMAGDIVTGNQVNYKKYPNLYYAYLPYDLLKDNKDKISYKYITYTTFNDSYITDTNDLGIKSYLEHFPETKDIKLSADYSKIQEAIASYDESLRIAAKYQNNVGICFVPLNDIAFEIFLQFDSNFDFVNVDENGNLVDNGLINKIDVKFTNNNSQTISGTNSKTLTAQRFSQITVPGSTGNTRVIKMQFEYEKLKDIYSASGATSFDIEANVYYNTGNYGLLYATKVNNPDPTNTSAGINNNNYLSLYKNQYNALHDSPYDDGTDYYTNVYSKSQHYYDFYNVDNIDVMESADCSISYDIGNALFSMPLDNEYTANAGNSGMNITTQTSLSFTTVPVEVKLISQTLSGVQQRNLQPTVKVDLDAGIQFIKFDLDYSFGSINRALGIDLMYFDTTDSTWKKVTKINDTDVNIPCSSEANAEHVFKSGVVEKFEIAEADSTITTIDIISGNNYKFCLRGKYSVSESVDFLVTDTGLTTFEIKALDSVKVVVTYLDKLALTKDGEPKDIDRDTKVLYTNYSIVDTHLRDIIYGVNNIKLDVVSSNNGIPIDQDNPSGEFTISANDIIDLILNKLREKYPNENVLNGINHENVSTIPNDSYLLTEKATLADLYAEFPWEPESSLQHVLGIEYLAYPRIEYKGGTTIEDANNSNNSNNSNILISYIDNGYFTVLNSFNKRFSGASVFSVKTTSNYKNTDTTSGLYVQFDVSAYDSYRLITGPIDGSTGTNVTYVVELYEGLGDDPNKQVSFNLDNNYEDQNQKTRIQDYVSVKEGPNGKNILVVTQPFENSVNKRSLLKLPLRHMCNVDDRGKRFTIKIYTILDGSNKDLDYIGSGEQDSYWSNDNGWKTDRALYSQTIGNDKTLVTSTVLARNALDIFVANAEYKLAANQVYINGNYLDEIKKITYQVISGGEGIGNPTTIIKDDPNSSFPFEPNPLVENQYILTLAQGSATNAGSDAYVRINFFANTADNAPQIAMIDAKQAGTN